MAGSRTASSLAVSLRGRALLQDPYYNKGTAFTEKERATFGLQGLLPAQTQTLQQQMDRAYDQYRAASNDLGRNVFMNSMLRQNMVLFYALLLSHIKEMMPVVYTPTEGDAIEAYSHLFRQPNGCFLSINDQDDMVTTLKRAADGRDVRYLVVTDGEQILGLGDQGTGGILISVAKLVLATACGGVNPFHTLPVVLDVGTNNDELRASPFYLGNRHQRVHGEQYQRFVDTFVKAANEAFPGIYIHFEDFGVKSAKRILDRYQTELACFNDDIQGTGCVCTAAVLSGLRVSKTPLAETRFLVYGAGSAGCGIAHQIARYITFETGCDTESACKQITCVDQEGVLTDDMGDRLSNEQAVFARSADEWTNVNKKDLVAVVEHIKPHVLIGTSGNARAFTESVIKTMAKHVDRPIVLPLSNPTKLSEAQPKDIINWTDGRALVATGSPYDAVQHNGSTHEIGEANNVVCYPGVGLGVVLSRAKMLSEEMLIAAIKALVSKSPIVSDVNAALVPDVADARDVSVAVAVAVIEQARRQGLSQNADLPANDAELQTWVEQQMWEASYPSYKLQK